MCPGPSAGLAVPAFVNGCPIGRRHAAFGISSAKHGRTTPEISSTQTPANIPRRIFIKSPDKAKGRAELPTGKPFTLGIGIENRYSRQVQVFHAYVPVTQKIAICVHTTSQNLPPAASRAILWRCAKLLLPILRPPPVCFLVWFSPWPR